MPARSLVLTLALLGCARSSRPEPAQPPPEPARDASPLSEPRGDLPPAKPDTGTTGVADAGAPLSTTPTAAANPQVKVVTIGMHVAGGPFDEATKEPFKKAVEPHFAELASCWDQHAPKPPKQADVGVDLLIEAAGGHPKVSNPRSTLDKAASEPLLHCVIATFESVAFPKLDRGRTGVSYSLRFTPR